MMDNLSQMVKDGPTDDPIVFSKTNLDIPAETQPVAEESNETTIKIIVLADWFDSNVDKFHDITKPQISVAKVDLYKQLVITTLEAMEDGEEEKKFVVYDNAHEMPVLNLPAFDMQIYNNNDFRILYDLGNGIFIKSYRVRNGLVSVFCNDINDQLVPYGIVRTKKRDTEIEIIKRNPEEVITKLSEALDVEALQLRYKQSVKSTDLSINQDAIDWLIERQGSIEDINHHLQIDNVIIDTLA